VVGGELGTIGLGDQVSARDAQQRVMGFIVVRGREIRLVGRNQRQSFCVGEIDQAGLDAALLLNAVTLQFDIEAIAEKACEALAARCREARMIGKERRRDRPVRTTGQRDEVAGVVLQPVELDVRGLMDRRLQERARVEPHQAAVAALAGSEQHDPRWTCGKRIARVGVLVAEIDSELAADDGLDAISGHLVGKFQRPEQVVGVGERQRRLAIGFRKLAEFCDLDRALQQRIGRMDVEMDESGARHGRLGLSASGVGAIAALKRATRSAMVMPQR